MGSGSLSIVLPWSLSVWLETLVAWDQRVSGQTGSWVLDWMGRPIPGLFAAGKAAAAPIGPAILSPGMTLGLAMTFGWLAGTTAATGDTSNPWLSSPENDQ